MHKDEFVSCDLCNGRFRSKLALDNHIKLKYSEKSLTEYNCPTCAKTFKYEANLKRHIKVEGHQYPTFKPSNNILKGFKPCPICGTTIGNTDFQTDYHMKKYHEDDSQIFSCKKCDKKFRRKETLHKHEENFHLTFNINFPAASQKLREGEDKWTCKMCKRSFQTTFDLNDHLIQNDCSKSVNVEHTCELCKKTYKYKHNLVEKNTNTILH